ncbi:hypothetical protein E1B28_009781 [Marasmius oreades]|uniref:Uncharacterized protein n=1 Tax=Marasmius oreades TaxID=181124 RepID=A0A9P7RWE4_9AGAR|nr:uncharacterized protein E1B28_009781 [Marasmius oreades]KAG7090683.1 hypothetical protein E1B28_009781 [Marasmius oreades]
MALCHPQLTVATIYAVVVYDLPSHSRRYHRYRFHQRPQPTVLELRAGLSSAGPSQSRAILAGQSRGDVEEVQRAEGEETPETNAQTATWWRHSGRAYDP